MRRAMDALVRYGGALPSFRKAHARGVCVRGTFTASPEVAALTIAEHLQGDPIETVLRLSNSSTSPHSGDRKTVLGMGVRFELPSGGHSAWAALTIERAPFRVPDDFIALTKATKRTRLGTPNFARVAAHAVTHVPSIPGMLAVLRQQTMQSFARSRFNGLHAYYLVDAEGRRRAFRYRWMPSEEPGTLTPEQDRAYPPQFLISELRSRLRKGPVSWTLVLQMADPGDPTDDVTKQWPESRPQIVAGTLVVDRLHEDPELVDDLMFDPTAVPPGIELSDDPVLHFRSEAYVASQELRRDEPKPDVVAE